MRSRSSCVAVSLSLLLALAAPCFPGAETPPADGSAEIAFTVEPTRGVTFSHTGNLAAGARIELEIKGLPLGQALLIERCGEPCDTARLAMAIRGDGAPARAETFTAADAGRYYFWIQRITPTGESGPLLISDFKAAGPTFRAQFGADVVVSGRLLPPGEGPPPPQQRRRDRVEILSVSPDPVSRGVEAEFVVEVEAELQSAEEGVVMIGFNTSKPESFIMQETRNLTRGAVRLTFKIHAAPVDWNRQADFAVMVNVGPKIQGGGWNSFAAAKHPIRVEP